jgi:hypothetical protein
VILTDGESFVKMCATHLAHGVVTDILVIAQDVKTDIGVMIVPMYVTTRNVNNAL